MRAERSKFYRFSLGTVFGGHSPGSPDSSGSTAKKKDAYFPGARELGRLFRWGITALWFEPLNQNVQCLLSGLSRKFNDLLAASGDGPATGASQETPGAFVPPRSTVHGAALLCFTRFGGLIQNFINPP